MTGRVLVVGSGASGVHFALSVLRRGQSVTMLDVGYRPRDEIAPELTLNGLKEKLPDPVGYLLGENFEGVLWPDSETEYYGIPPSKGYVLKNAPSFSHHSNGFAPLFSFARGGFAEAWTAGCYPFNEAELTDFPFPYDELVRQYDEVARRIGITGTEDDLTRFLPVHTNLMPPLRLDAHSARLLETYERKRLLLNSDGVYLGRTRVATLSQDLGPRQACNYLGRCLWGCPRGSLYTPSHTLRECHKHDNFEYYPGVEVEYFRVGTGQRIRSVIARPLGGGPSQEIDVDQVALAAGTLLSSRIFLRSWQRETGESVSLKGLMDNRQVLLPYINLGMLGQPFDPESYQYHLLGMGIDLGAPTGYVHGQITTLKTGMLHPIIQRLPFDLAQSLYLTRVAHAALGVINVSFPDKRRDNSRVGLTSRGDGTRELKIEYVPATDERLRIREVMRKITKALRTLGCFVPMGMTHIRPMGASVHYAGTLPMTREAAPLTTTEYGQSRDFENLFVVDGSTFPSLPAKNITFTLMANAARIGSAAF